MKPTVSDHTIDVNGQHGIFVTESRPKDFGPSCVHSFDVPDTF